MHIRNQEKHFVQSSCCMDGHGHMKITCWIWYLFTIFYLHITYRASGFHRKVLLNLIRKFLSCDFSNQDQRQTRMDSETQDIDTVKIQAENRKLKKEMRELVIQKNTMEDRLYRAVNKVLNTKKRRIKQLEAELEMFKKSGNPGDTADAGHHCKTCRCGVDDVNKGEDRDEPVMKKTRKAKQMPDLISDDDDDSDNTEDPGSRYGSDTDIDEEPASATSSRNTSPVKPNTGAVASREPTLEKVNVPEPVQSPLTNNDDDESEDSQSILNPDVQISKPPPANPELQGSQKSDYDMEDMMEEFCS